MPDDVQACLKKSIAENIQSVLRYEITIRTNHGDVCDLTRYTEIRNTWAKWINERLAYIAARACNECVPFKSRRSPDDFTNCADDATVLLLRLWDRVTLPDSPPIQYKFTKTRITPESS